MNEIRFTLMPISGAAKESGGYRAKILRRPGKEAMNCDAVIAEAIDTHLTGMSPIMVKTVVTGVFRSMIEGVARDGTTRHIDDFLSLSLKIHGRFDDKSDDFDEGRHRLAMVVSQLNEFRPELRGAKVVNVNRKRQFRLYSVHSEGVEGSGRIVPGRVIVLKGADLDLDVPLEWVALNVALSPTSGESFGTLDILSKSESEIRCACPSELTDNAEKYYGKAFDISAAKYSDPEDLSTRTSRTVRGVIVRP